VSFCQAGDGCVPARQAWPWLRRQTQLLMAQPPTWTAKSSSMPSLLIPCSKHSCMGRTMLLSTHDCCWEGQGGQEPWGYLLPELASYLVAALAYLETDDFAGHVH
jgi:hypothetical protein